MTEKTKRVLLIDADICLYRCGFSVEKRFYVVERKEETLLITKSHKEAVEFVRARPTETLTIEYRVEVEPISHALQNVTTVIGAIRDVYPDAEPRLFLTGKGNYRYTVATLQPYKGNRSPFAKPTHYEGIKEFLIKQYKAKLIEGMEADDEIGIQATELAQAGLEPIIVSTDKDLDMIPGLHYNWVKKEEYDITDEEGFLNFYRQCLTGDSVDNVPGIEGVGPVGAGKILANCRGPSTMLYEVREAWGEHYPNGVTGHDGRKLSAGNALQEVAQLLWIKRSRDEPLWHYRLIKD